MFGRMEIAEQMYKVKSLSKTNIRSDVNRESHISKRKWGEASSPNNPEKGRTGKRKTNNAVSLSKKTDDSEEKIVAWPQTLF